MHDMVAKNDEYLPPFFSLREIEYPEYVTQTGLSLQLNRIPLRSQQLGVDERQSVLRLQSVEIQN